MKSALISVCGLLLSCSAQAYEVYNGCATPQNVSGKSTHFIDPVRGSNHGSGTAKDPWKSLSFVIDPTNKIISTRSRKGGTNTPLLPVNTAGALKGGDTIMLMSGNYGDVTVQNAFNDNFITVTAAPGQNPVLNHLRVNGGSKWIFQSLTFSFANQSAPNVVMPANNLTQVYDGWQGASSDIIFDSSIFTSASNTASWSDADWFSRPELYSLNIRSQCVSVNHSVFNNVSNALALFGSKSLIKNNIVDRFSNDAIDLVTGDVTIYGNTIQNGMSNRLTPWHPDGIQGWSQTINGKKVENSNVLIDSNRVYNSNLSKDNYLQGIDMFNGLWNNLVIQNNIVVTNHFHGISVWGAKNASIINNTVLPSNSAAFPTWIQVQPSIDGDSKNVIIRNNVAYQILALDKSIVFDHNATVVGFANIQNGKAKTSKSSDNNTKNLVIPSVMSSFQSFNPAKDQFDVRLNSKSALVAAGTAVTMPRVDIIGRTRTGVADIGAYEH